MRRSFFTVDFLKNDYFDVGYVACGIKESFLHTMLMYPVFLCLAWYRILSDKLETVTGSDDYTVGSSLQFTAAAIQLTFLPAFLCQRIIKWNDPASYPLMTIFTQVMWFPGTLSAVGKCLDRLAWDTVVSLLVIVGSPLNLFKGASAVFSLLLGLTMFIISSVLQIPLGILAQSEAAALYLCCPSGTRIFQPIFWLLVAFQRKYVFTLHAPYYLFFLPTVVPRADLEENPVIASASDARPLLPISSSE